MRARAAGLTACTLLNMYWTIEICIDITDFIYAVFSFDVIKDILQIIFLLYYTQRSVIIKLATWNLNYTKGNMFWHPATFSMRNLTVFGNFLKKYLSYHRVL